jgi:hypothetical protein
MSDNSLGRRPNSLPPLSLKVRNLTLPFGLCWLLLLLLLLLPLLPSPACNEDFCFGLVAELLKAFRLTPFLDPKSNPLLGPVTLQLVVLSAYNSTPSWKLR